MSVKNTHENVISMLYETSFDLPNPWNVIYQEGVRGSHILFQMSKIENVNPTHLDYDYLTNIAVDIFNSRCLTEMQHKVAQLDENTMCGLFVLYRHFLFQWKQHLKQSLLN